MKQQRPHEDTGCKCRTYRVKTVGEAHFTAITQYIYIYIQTTAHANAIISQMMNYMYFNMLSKCIVEYS